MSYKGQRVIVGWPEKIEEAQTITFYMISEKQYNRIQYGQELHRKATKDHPCHDCAVSMNEFHIPGCDMGPKCHEQAIGCGCPLKITALH